MTFDDIFIDVFEDITSSYMTSDWAVVLHEKSPAEWLATIKRYTPAEVVELLGRDEPPTIAELQALPKAGQNDQAGVYGNILEGLNGDTNVVYCGSASRTSSNYRGFAARIRDHETAPPDNLHHRLMVGRRSTFVILLLIPNWLPYLNEYELTEYRFIIGIAEALYTAWLGAYAESRISEDLLNMCPYGRSSLDLEVYARTRPCFKAHERRFDMIVLEY